jgi:iron complex transport system ATP-binding protein
MELTQGIKVQDLFFSYTDKPVLNGVSLHVLPGEIVTLLGPNGSGKSTLLKSMLGLLRARKGSVFLNGRDISRIGQKALACEIAYVPQIHRNSFPYRVVDVVLMGRIPHKAFFFKYSREDLDIAAKVLEKLSISHLADRPYTEISGGERQLTLIARALAQGARTLIMDEPAAGLDYGNQIRLLTQILLLSREEGYTFVKSTHSPEHALWIASRVIMIKDGAILADGKSDDVVNTSNLRDLYRTEVTVATVNGFSAKVCIPEDLHSRLEDRIGAGGARGSLNHH